MEDMKQTIVPTNSAPSLFDAITKPIHLFIIPAKNYVECDIEHFWGFIKLMARIVNMDKKSQLEKTLWLTRH